MNKIVTLSLASVLGVASMGANATFVSLGACTGANDCIITDTPPNPVAPNPNNGILLAWNEVQNFTLTEALRVDRVFDPTADFITAIGSDFLINAGTIVSSHYLQWDPGLGSNNRIETTISLDSQVFGFITADQNLFDSDFLGLPGLDYNDFGLRGLESGDTTDFNGSNTDISWSASSPGDWTRLITAFSPGGEPPTEPPTEPPPVTGVPEPNMLWLFAAGFTGFLGSRRFAKRDR
jgi:hypothetical protein